MATAPRQRARRRPAPSTEVDLTERKQKVLHTRVPESLDRHIKSRARGLGLSVSTVVRHVLLNTFGLVEDIVTDSTNVALAIAGERAVTPGEIVAWQEVVLNLNAVCEHCNEVLRKGVRAAIAVRSEPGPQAVICPSCLKRIGESVPDTDA